MLATLILFGLVGLVGISMMVAGVLLELRQAKCRKLVSNESLIEF